MAILARYKPLDIEVQVVSVLTAGNRKRVLIRALQGTPFFCNSHGGPVDTDSTLTSVDLLEDVRQEPPALTGRELRHMRRQAEMAASDPMRAPLLKDNRGAFPHRGTGRNSTSTGGVNND